MRTYFVTKTSFDNDFNCGIAYFPLFFKRYISILLMIDYFKLNTIERKNDA